MVNMNFLCLWGLIIFPFRNLSIFLLFPCLRWILSYKYLGFIPIIGYTSKTLVENFLSMFSIIGVSPERTKAVIKQDLIALIEKKRAELIQVAVTNGLTSSIAIRYSQELDHLINEYNRKYIKKPRQVASL